MSAQDYFNKLWDWTPLNQCFARNIRVADIDGQVEVSKNWLILEGKTENVEMPEGQRKSLERMSALPEFTVVVFYGEPPDIRTVKNWEVWNGPEITEYKGDFVNFVSEWFERTDMAEIDPDRFILTDEKYSTGFILDDYNGVLSLVNCRRSDRGRIFTQWCYPEVRDGDRNAPAAKSLPWKITLGDRHRAIEALYAVLEMLGEEAGPAPDTPQTWEDDDDIPF